MIYRRKNKEYSGQIDSVKHPKIIEDYSSCVVNVGRIVQRLVKFAPFGSLDELNEIRIMDNDPDEIGFARYFKEEKIIELFVNDIIGWQPWLLKRTYILPYLSIGIALGHELDHHVNRLNNSRDKEHQAEVNAFKYVYPSLGFFKPIAKIVSYLANVRKKNEIKA